MAEVVVTQVPVRAMISVRIDPSSATARSLEAALGTTLPRAVGEVSGDGPHRVLWLGPDEWLIVSDLRAAQVVTELEQAVADAHAAIVDVTANRALIELAGSSARDVLEKGCPLDLHPRSIGPGRAMLTTLARVPLLLWQIGPATYRLLPRSSFAAYVTAWLEDAAAEFR